MKKIKVCCGTSCYIMGSSELIAMDFSKYKDVTVEGTTCMNLCNQENKRPPFVTIDDVLYSEVTPNKLISLIEGKTDDLQ